MMVKGWLKGVLNYIACKYVGPKVFISGISLLQTQPSNMYSVCFHISNLF